MAPLLKSAEKLRKLSVRREQIEARLALAILGNHCCCAGVARLPLGINDVEIADHAFAVSECRQTKCLFGLRGSGTRCAQRGLGMGQPVESGAHL